MAAALTSSSRFETEIQEENSSPIPSSSSVTDQHKYSHAFDLNSVTKLTGKETFKMWNTHMTNLLENQGVFGLVCDEYDIKEEDVTSWEKCDSKVKDWILDSLTQKLGTFFVGRLLMRNQGGEISSKDLWEEIKGFYGPTSESETGYELVSVHEDYPVSSRNFMSRIYEEIKKGKSADYIVSMLRWGHLKAADTITSNGDTILHVALVGSSTNNTKVFEELLATVAQEDTLSAIKNSHGSSLLHVAAIVGNITAVDILIGKDPNLLKLQDNDGKTALTLSILNGHSKISLRLLRHIKDKGLSSDMLHGETSIDPIVLATTSKDFCLAREIHDACGAFPNSDAVLTALAQNFPRDPYFWGSNFESLVRLLIWFHLLKDPSQDFKQAMFILEKECDSKFTRLQPKNYSPAYKKSLFEATRHNSPRVVTWIINMFPNAVWSVNDDGHDIIQHSVICRSEKIYNMLYDMTQHYNTYRSKKDSSDNNLAHLAARLSPFSKLNEIRGEALQFQYDLKWFNEVVEFVSPFIRSHQNSKGETPQDVFTREHKDLMEAGEAWLKVSANSYVLVATFIITMTFAAAITVPGGSDSSGLSIHRNHVFFWIFVIAIGISFSCGLNSLLLFLFVINARFGEQDFLYKLP